METAIRRQMIINPVIMDLLNNQISMEMHASASYLAMASWCDQRGFENSKSFMYKQSEEEREHAMKIFEFINENGGCAISPNVENINNDFESLKDIFEKSLDQEIKVTESIFNIFKNARKENDYVSEVFLQWFISEQSKEENTFRGILDIFEIMKGDSITLKMIDERIPKE